MAYISNLIVSPPSARLTSNIFLLFSVFRSVFALKLKKYLFLVDFTILFQLNNELELCGEVRMGDI